MTDGPTTHMVVNTGPAAPELISGWGEGDVLALVGFLSADPAGASEPAAVRQSVLPGAEGGASLRLDVFEPGAPEPSAVVVLVGVAHPLHADAVVRW